MENDTKARICRIVEVTNIMKILIAGDYCDNARISQLIHNKKYNDLFGGIKGVMSLYDYRVVNFEFPIVVGKTDPIQKCGPALSGQLEAVAALKEVGVNVCTLANNHILDQGAQCLIDTKRLLEDAGIKTVGAGANKIEASEVLLLERNGETTAIINCCEHEFSISSDNKAGANPLDIVAQYRSIKKAKEQFDYVIVIVHGGIEHFQYPTQRMKDIYRFFIEAGADAVINHHQHCYCGYEIYNGKLIMYGLGNFLFDWEGKRNSIWNEGAMVGLNLKKDGKSDFEIYPYTQCNDIPCVRLMTEDEKRIFAAKSEEINKVIQDDRLLSLVFDKHVDEKKKEYQLLVEPYDTRLTKGLFNRGLLPSMISKAKLTKLYNYIYCESHEGVLLSVLKDLMLRE